MLTYHRCTTVAQQFVVVQQTSCYRILDGGHTYHRWVLTHTLIHLFKGVAANQLQLFSLEILMGGNVVERPYLSLYCNSLHCINA